MENNYSYFENKECKYFPCHKNGGEKFNCMFCYCPLYALGDSCGGNFVYTEDGTKDCSDCCIPHNEKGYSYIISKFPQVSEFAKKNRNKSEKKEK